MDDVRAFLLGISKGWRPTSRGLDYCVAWEEEDSNLTLTEVTKRCLSASLNGIKNFLKFTMETGEDEGFDGWLPTLDTSLRVNEANKVEYKFYEKPTSSNRCLPASSAMNINTK